jgi:hypothetical protein
LLRRGKRRDGPRLCKNPEVVGTAPTGSSPPAATGFFDGYPADQQQSSKGGRVKMALSRVFTFRHMRLRELALLGVPLAFLAPPIARALEIRSEK